MYAHMHDACQIFRLNWKENHIKRSIENSKRENIRFFYQHTNVIPITKRKTFLFLNIRICFFDSHICVFIVHMHTVYLYICWLTCSHTQHKTCKCIYILLLFVNIFAKCVQRKTEID